MTRRIVSIALAALMALALAVTPAACADNKTLTVFNCFDYIDEEVLELFEQETGIKVTYVNYTGNEELYAKLKNSNGGYDVIFPSDYMIERMINEEMLEELDMSQIPNAQGLIDWCSSPDYDPENKYSVAYMWGKLGILYNEDYVDDEIDSWGVLFDEQYQRDVFMMDSIRDTFGLTLKYMGSSLNTHSEEELDKAKELLLAQKDSGVVAGYLLDETKDKMVAGEAALAVMYSGDAMYAIEENESLKYVVPKEGSNIWIDGMCVPKGCKNFDGAMQFINFMCRPDIAAMNQDYISYSSPIQEVVDNYTDEKKAQPAINPSDEVIERCEFFHDLADDIKLYDERWIEIRA